MLAVLLFLMLLGSLNYANNPAYLLTFLLISLSTNAMYQTWHNLRGVQIQQMATRPVFCGQEACFQYQLSSQNSTEKPAIQVNFDFSQASVADLKTSQLPEILSLNHLTHHRGMVKPGALIVSTRFPLGLFRAWCYIDNVEGVLVYPKLAKESPYLFVSSNNLLHKNNQADMLGNDDFLQLRNYQLGDSPRQIDWKAFAKERGLMSKQFSSQQGDPLIIDWSNFSDEKIETRLSLMARAIVSADNNHLAYALHLPNMKIASNSGSKHRHECLSALALFDNTGHSSD